MRLKIVLATLTLILIFLAVPIFAQNASKKAPVFDPHTYRYSPDTIRVKYLQLLHPYGGPHPGTCSPELEGTIAYNKSNKSLMVCTDSEWVRIVREMTGEERANLTKKIQNEVEQMRKTYPKPQTKS